MYSVVPRSSEDGAKASATQPSRSRQVIAVAGAGGCRGGRRRDLSADRGDRADDDEHRVQHERALEHAALRTHHEERLRQRIPKESEHAAGVAGRVKVIRIVVAELREPPL